MMFFLLVSVIVWGGGFTSTSFCFGQGRVMDIYRLCLWLATWVSWGCCPPLYVWIERKWRRASWRRCSYALLSPISLISLIYVCSFVSDIVNKPYGSRMEISYKVGVGLPAYEVIDRIPSIFFTAICTILSS